MRYKVEKMWMTDAATWLIFEDKKDRDSLFMKKNKLNREEIFNIEEVKEEREKWYRRGKSQEERLERARQKFKENGEDKGADEKRLMRMKIPNKKK